MRIRLDENISPRVARAIIALSENRKGFEVSYVRELHGPGTQDVEWIPQFAKEGGTAIISGDYNILRNWPDLIAYKESGLTGIFPPPKFNTMEGYAKAALIIRWWPTIINKIMQSSRGSTWRLPMRWTPDMDSFKRLEDPRFGKDGKIISIAEEQVHRGNRTTRT